MLIAAQPFFPKLLLQLETICRLAKSCLKKDYLNFTKRASLVLLESQSGLKRLQSLTVCNVSHCSGTLQCGDSPVRAEHNGRWGG